MDEEPRKYVSVSVKPSLHDMARRHAFVFQRPIAEVYEAALGEYFNAHDLPDVIKFSAASSISPNGPPKRYPSLEVENCVAFFRHGIPPKISPATVSFYRDQARKLMEKRGLAPEDVARLEAYLQELDAWLKEKGVI